MKKIMLLCLVLIGVIFSGCATSYDIKPKYNETAKEVKIDGFSLPDINYYTEKKQMLPSGSGNTWFINKSIKSTSGICRRLDVIEYDSTNRWFFYNSAKDDVLTNHNGRCDVEEVEGGLNFIICDNEYFLTTSKIQGAGFAQKTTLKVDMGCFFNLKTHFKSLTQEGTKLTKFDRKKIKTYTGTFVSTKASKCTSTGTISVYISDKSVGGSITYSLNGNEYTSEIKGNIIDKTFAGNTENIKFIGDIREKSIEGKYYNDECEGVFSAQLEKN